MINLIFSILIFNIPITKIDFIGNKSISSRDLHEVIVSSKNSEYYEANFTYDSTKILRLYESRGFFDVEVMPKANKTEQGIEINFFIKEGVRPKIEEIKVQGDDEEKIRKSYHIHINDFFIKEKIDKTEKAIENYYKNNGYPYASVSSSMTPESGILIFKIEKGVLHYIRDIELHGLKSCNPNVLRREVKLNNGDIFNRSKLFNSQRNIYGLGFFSTIDVEILRHEPDTIDLIFTVRELKSRILNFGLGFSIPLSFLFSFGVEELNLFNIGHRFQIRPSFKINIEGEWEGKLEGRYTIPHFTPARLTISLLPFYWIEEKVDFSRITSGAEFRISKVYNENIQFNIANKYKYVDFRPNVTFPDTLKGLTNSVKFQFMIDYRDNFFTPNKGVYLLPVIEYAGGMFGGDNNFLRLEIEERLFIPFLKNTIAQRLKIGKMFPTDGLEIYEKYYLGGQYSLRGYPERSIGPDSIANEKYGNILANFNIEYRISLPYNFGLVGFFDVGYINNEIDFTNNNFLKSSAGLGLRYYTPIGPLRCDIGFPLKDKGYEIYFGIYHIF